MSNLSIFAADPLVDEVLRSFLRPAPQAKAIRIDVSESADAYTVKAEIPGVRKEDIDIRIEGNEVSVSAEVNKQGEEKQAGRVLRSERYKGSVSRTFALGSHVDESRSTAKYENGVLELVLPKRSANASNRLAVS